MHQHPRGSGGLRLRQLRLDKVRRIHLHQIGRAFGGLGNRGVHPLEPHGVFGPNVGLKPQRLRWVGQINRGNIAAFGRYDLDRVFGRRVALPIGREPHRARLRPDLHAAQIIVIAREHQVDPGARADFEALEPRRQSPARQPQHRRDEIARPSRLIGLRRAIQPRQQRRLVPQQRCADNGRIVRGPAGIDRRQRRFGPAQVQ